MIRASTLLENSELGLPNITEPQFGSCEIKINSRYKLVEPRPKVRGTIARAYLYMSAVYKIELTDKENALFNSWHKKYPPEEWEVEWDHNVSKFQGNHNLFIQKNDLK